MVKLNNKYLLSKNINKIIDKRVLVRVDLNIETCGFTQIENYRIKIAKDLLKFLESAKQIIFISHLGQPPYADQRGYADYSLEKFIPYLPEFKFVNWKYEENAKNDKSFLASKNNAENDNSFSATEMTKTYFSSFPSFSALPNDKFILLENLRFFEGEEKNDIEFAKSLSELADVFVNEAFSVSHRNHASIIEIPKFLPSYFGINFENEIRNLNKVFESDNKLAIVIGGAKIETKLPLIKKFLNKADLIVLGGLTAKEFTETHQIENDRILIPQKVNDDTDLKSIKIFLKRLKKMDIIVWNGPFAKLSDGESEAGTLLFAKELVRMKNFTIVGGGDTISFLYKHKLHSKFDFISTGGGAMLNYLANETLPGLEAIQK